MISDELSEGASRILKESNTLLEGDHFVYISGDHGSGWVNKDALLPDTKKVSQLAHYLSQAIKDIKVDVICGPAIGGLVMSQWVAHHAGLPSVFAEHCSESNSTRASDKHEMRPPFVLRRGFDRLVKGKRILIVDDIVNTGHSIRQTAAAVQAAGGTVVGAAAYCTRGNCDAADMEVDKFIYLVQFKIPSWSAASCQLCKQGVPVNTDYAHGKEFLQAQRITV